jgi:hypothetical protein
MKIRLIGLMFLNCKDRRTEGESYFNRRSAGMHTLRKGARSSAYTHHTDNIALSASLAFTASSYTTIVDQTDSN